jgi:DNA replication protein DnaC
MNDALLSALRQLRLSGMAQSLDVRLQEAAGNHLTHAEFLELILQDELSVRADRQVERRVKAAGFRDQRTLEDFDLTFNPSVKRKQVFDLAAGAFVRQGRDVLLLGPPEGVTWCYTSLPCWKSSACDSVPLGRGSL